MHRRSWLAAAGAASSMTLWPQWVRASRSEVHTLRYAFEVANPTDRAQAEVALTVWAPLARGLWHERVQVRSAVAHQMVHSAAHSEEVRFALGVVPPHALRVIALEVDVALPPQPLMLEAPQPGADLGAAHLLEADDASIVRLASTLRRETALATAAAIFDWVQAHLTYAGYVAPAHGARAALALRRGDCTEYAFLAAALARAAGVPARVMSGFVLATQSDSRPLLQARAVHDWCEVYAQGRWRLLDAQRGLWDPGVNPGYVAFVQMSAMPTAQRFAVTAPLRVKWV